MTAVVELIQGLEVGGAERALAARLAYQPTWVETTVVSCGPCDPAISASVTARCKRFFHVSTASEAVRVAKQIEEPGILVSHNPRIAFHLLQGESKHRRVIVAHNSIASENPLKSKLLKNLLRYRNSHADLHIGVSEAALSGEQCLGAEKLELVYLGSTIEAPEQPDVVAHYRGLWPNQQGPRLLALSRFSVQKNLRALLGALGRIREELGRSHGSILLVGDGPLRQKLDQKIRRLELEHYVRLIAGVSDPQNMLAAADLLLIPSLHEGGPLTMYEALSVGTPVLATPVGAVPEIARASANCSLIEGFSEIEIAHALESSLKKVDDATRLIIRDDARDLQPQVSAERFYRALEEILI